MTLPSPSGNDQPRGQGTEVTGMQYIEASVIGVRSAVITLKRRATPLRFVLIPMVHVAEPDFYREVASLAGECALIVAEGRGGIRSRPYPGCGRLSDRHLPVLRRECRGLTVAHAPD